MPADHHADLARRLANILRAGVIAEVDHPRTLCRVTSGAITTTWLPWLAQRAGTTLTWSPPTVGEQCLVLAPCGDLAAGVVLVGINSTANPAPSTSPDHTVSKYSDGAVISYDHAQHALSATLPAGGTITITAPNAVTIHTSAATVHADSLTASISGAATITAATITATASGSADVTATTVSVTGTTAITGDTTITGALTVSGPITGAGGMAVSGGAGASVTGSMAVTGGDITANGISLTGHTHPVPEHAGTSGTPQ